MDYDRIIYFQATKLANRFEPAVSTYTGSRTDWHSIKSFAAKQYVGIVGHMTPSTEKFFSKPIMVLFGEIDFKTNPSLAKYFRNRLLLLANQEPQSGILLLSFEGFIFDRVI